MGFGFLFVGYLLTFNFIGYNQYTDIFAALLMLYGLSTLSKYAPAFRTALYVGIPLALFSAVTFGVRLGTLIGLIKALPSIVSSFLAVASTALWFAFLWFVLTGVKQISTETAIPVLTARAMRQRVMILLFFALRLVLESNLLKEVGWFAYGLTVVYLLFGLITVFLNAKLLYECYIWICLEGEESMEKKPSRFGFLNRLRDMEEKMEERTLARKAEERRLREERKQNKKGGKKK